MERNRGTEAEHESLEDEGIPDIGVPHPAKRSTGDPQEGLIAPRDQARAAEDTGVTAEEQREGASLDERIAEEEPDEEPGRRHEAGRLVEDGGLIDEEKDLVADAAEDEVEGRSAEETAVRIEEEAPDGLTDGPDSYLEDQPEKG
jgi:hypothetical protein